MKKLSLLLALVVIAGIASAQTTIFSDNMESFPTGWTLSPTTGWVKSSTYKYSGTYSARGDDVSPYAASQNNYMSKTGLTLSSYSSVTLKFYLWQYTEASYDYIRVQYYSGSTWTTAWQRAGSYQSWAQQSVTIPNTATGVRFWFYSDGSVQNTGVFIDDVLLQGTTSTVTQNDAGTGGDAGNTIATATLVNPGSWTGCYLDATDREDYYKFNVTSGQVIKVKITPPSAADFDLYLHNPSQTQVGSSTRGAGLVDSIVYTANATGYWYCRAYQYSGTGNYSLQISVSGGTTGTWTTVTSTTQSAHPYTNSYNYTWTITGPSSATKMKVYFDSIKVETGYDTVFVLNGSGTVIQKWTGTYRAIWSNEVTGNVIKIKLKTDATVTGYGFLSTKYQHYTTTASSPADPFGDEENAPAELLSQNHPNPVVGRTTFTYNLPDDRQASLRVYNIAGQHVRTVATGLQKAGRHSIEWDARDEYGRPVANGTYIYRLEAGDLGATRKMLILK
jgi:hypothetical protein